MKLKKYKKLSFRKEYNVLEDIAGWLSINGHKSKRKHVMKFIYKVGGLFYPYQKADRKKIQRKLK